MKTLRKNKVVIESMIKSSPTVLYNMLATPSGLASWFCDDVNIKHNSKYVFYWGNNAYEAQLVGQKKDHYIRFAWIHPNHSDTYFEFKIEKDDLTNDVFLIITSNTDPNTHDIEEEDWLLMTSKLKTCIRG